MSEWIDWLRAQPWLVPGPSRRLLVSLAILGAVLALRWLVLALVRRRSDDLRLQYQWKKASAYVAFFVVALLVGRVWFEGVASLATYLGLLSAGVAIALKDPLVNLAAWAFLLWRRPFEVGDRIQVGDTAGDVIDQRIFQFTLLEIGNWVAADQSTGRIVHVPNGAVFTQPVANYTRGFRFIWNEIAVTVTFESDWRRARKLLEEIAAGHGSDLAAEAQEQVRRAARKFMIFYSTLTPAVYTSVADSGVVLTLRYLCDPRNRRGSAQEIWEEVLERFGAAEDIDFAYPTRRYFDNAREGKSGTGGPAP